MSKKAKTSKNDLKEKYKRVCSVLLTFLNRVSFIFDAVVLYWLFSFYGGMENRDTVQNFLYYGVIVLAIVLVYRTCKSLFLVWKSGTERDIYLRSNRVLAIGGKQRVGKTSIALYFSKWRPRSVYSNVPFCLNGNYTKKLTTDILTLKTRISDDSILVIDEANLFYNNQQTDDKNITLYAQAVLCQCVGHFFDGNIFYVATDIDRVPKMIRDNYSAKAQVLESRCYNYSIVGSMVVKALSFLLLREKVKYTGLRIWRMQHYEKIMEEQYIGLVGQTENQNKFAPIYEFAGYQQIGAMEYEDRYMREYYANRPENIDVFWDKFQLDKEDFKNLYDGILARYIDTVDGDEKKSVKVKIVDNGNVQNNTDSQ